jgi:hypothetical protein
MEFKVIIIIIIIIIINIIIAFFNILHSKKYFQAKLSSLLGYIFYVTCVIVYSETFFRTTDNVLASTPHKIFNRNPLICVGVSMCCRTWRLVGRDFQFRIHVFYVVQKLTINKIKYLLVFTSYMALFNFIHTKLIKFPGCFIMSLPSTMVYFLTIHEVGTYWEVYASLHCYFLVCIEVHGEIMVPSMIRCNS